MKDLVLSFFIHSIEHGCLYDAVAAQAIVANTSDKQRGIQKPCNGHVEAAQIEIVTDKGATVLTLLRLETDSRRLFPGPHIAKDQPGSNTAWPSILNMGLLDVYKSPYIFSSEAMRKIDDGIPSQFRKPKISISSRALVFIFCNVNVHVVSTERWYDWESQWEVSWLNRNSGAKLL
jgi:hypothetical protein